MDAGYTFVYFRLLLWHKNIFVSPCRTEKKTLDLQLGIKKKNLRYIVIIFKLHIEYLFDYFTQSDLYYYYYYFLNQVYCYHWNSTKPWTSRFSSLQDPPSAAISNLICWENVKKWMRRSQIKPLKCWGCFLRITESFQANLNTVCLLVSYAWH